MTSFTPAFWVYGPEGKKIDDYTDDDWEKLFDKSKRGFEVYDSMIEHKSPYPIMDKLSLSLSEAIKLFEQAILYILSADRKFDPEKDHEQKRKELLEYHGFEDIWESPLKVMAI